MCVNNNFWTNDLDPDIWHSGPSRHYIGHVWRWKVKVQARMRKNVAEVVGVTFCECFLVLCVFQSSGRVSICCKPVDDEFNFLRQLLKFFCSLCKWSSTICITVRTHSIRDITSAWTNAWTGPMTPWSPLAVSMMLRLAVLRQLHAQCNSVCL